MCQIVNTTLPIYQRYGVGSVWPSVSKKKNNKKYIYTKGGASLALIQNFIQNKVDVPSHY